MALADEVIAQPRGRQRAVFSLGPSDRISLTEKLKDAFPFGIPSKEIEFIAERVDGCKTGPKPFSASSAPIKTSTPRRWTSFRLRDWERTGLLEDITLTVKRLHQPESADGEPDDIIVTYDQLSDGEQMLLGRMGLLFLLRGQDGSLLLLDEPETHFNDVWKREIVEMVDMGLLNPPMPTLSFPPTRASPSQTPSPLKSPCWTRRKAKSPREASLAASSAPTLARSQ